MIKPFFYYQTQQINRVLVLGLGISGVSVVDFLITYALEIDIFDQNSQNSHFSIDYQNFDNIELESYDLIVVSPGIPVNKSPFNRLQFHWHNVISDIELFALHIAIHNNNRNKRQKVIAVTGSNGKSTVVSLLYHVLKNLGIQAAVGGNIGIPALNLINKKINVYVLEISSFQIDLLKKAQFDITVVLNLSPDHLDRYADYEMYCNVKLGLLARGKYNLINAKQKSLITEKTYKNLHYFNTEATCINDDKAVFNNEIFCQQSEIFLQGKHNLENILAVLLVLDKLMMSLNDNKAIIKDAIASFNPLSHRCRFIRDFKGIRYINDSKATNIASTEAALIGLGSKDAKNIIVLLGGLTKGTDFSELLPVLKIYAEKALIYGQDRIQIYQAIVGEVDCVLCENFDQAFNTGVMLACQNDIVLLSPGCASFDGFSNYVHRGEYFEKLVNELR